MSEEKPHLACRAIVKRFGRTVAVGGVSLDVARGEFVTLLGPSGCGKSTLLRIIAGFLSADEGSVAIGGRAIDDLPPMRRGIGFVFQAYALFPTKTVFDNIAFGLRVRHRPEKEVRRRVAELCALVRLEGLEGRYPHELSGGQQQRVAVARTLAVEPALILLDEPLSALDAQLRLHLRQELRQLTSRLGVTAIYVTHDQAEALELSDRIAVMRDGRFEQVGRPQEIYLTPANRYVAEFVGTASVLSAEIDADGRVRPSGSAEPIAVAGPGTGRDRRCTVSLRPEFVDVARMNGHINGQGGPTAEVLRTDFLGHAMRVTLGIRSGETLLADVPVERWQAEGVAVGDRVSWSVPSERVVLLQEAPPEAEQPDRG